MTAPYLDKLADGVFAYVQPEGGWCVSNAGIVTGGGTTILVDTAATESRARKLKDAIGPARVNILVNTHHHGDHVFGNAQFAPAATIVAHDLAREEMPTAPGLRNLWPDVDWGETPVTLPTLTFRDQVTLHAGDLRVELVHVGPAHTSNDVVAWIPEHGVLFAGDVVMSGVTPFCLMGSVAGSLRALARLNELGARTIVSGHGVVAGPETIDRTEQYLRWIDHLAADGLAAGLTPLEVARSADPRAFAELLDPERIVGNLHSAYADRTGTAVDILAGFQDMLTYHGGRPACHA